MRELMKRFKRTDYFTQTYGGSFIKQIDASCDSGLCFLYFADGTIMFFNTEFTIFNTQYGISVSEKHHCIFIGTWRKGLYCYDAYTGERLWRSPMGSNRDMFVPPHSDYIITTRAGKGLFRLDIATGQVCDSLRSTNTENAFDVSDSVVFVDRLGHDYCLVDLERFLVIKRYPISEVHPPYVTSFVVTDAWLEYNHATRLYELWIEFLSKFWGEEDSLTLSRYRRQIDSFPSLDALRNDC